MIAQTIEPRPPPAPTHILTKKLEVPKHQTFDTFAPALNYTLAMQRTVSEAGHHCYAARIWQDRFPRYRPRGLTPQLLGLSPKALRDCQRLAPGGRWTIMAEVTTPSLSIFGDISEQTLDGVQFSCWYTRFLPYAWAMMHAEEGYQAFGLDFESINSYFKTCMGFYEIGMGHNPDLDDADSLLFDYCHATSCEVKPPSLPFDEVFRACACYVFIRAPRLFARSWVKRCEWLRAHVAEVKNRIADSTEGRHLLTTDH